MRRPRRGGLHAGVVPALAVLLALCAPPLQAGEADAGARLYRERGCVLCHGAEGRQPAEESYPVLAGQRRAYLVQQLRDLRSGLRSNGRAALMRRFVERLGDEEIEALAHWLSTRAACGGDDRC